MVEGKEGRLPVLEASLVFDRRKFFQNIVSKALKDLLDLYDYLDRWERPGPEAKTEVQRLLLRSHGLLNSLRAQWEILLRREAVTKLREAGNVG